jgi:integrase
VTKRREDTIPLRPDVGASMQAHLSDKLPAACAFDMPTSSRTTAMFGDDPADAGIPRCEAGVYVDFHSLRHTFISNLARGGVHPSVAQDLARHSDIRLTMNHYTHTVLEDRLTALERLPDLTTPTDDCGADGSPAN